MSPDLKKLFNSKHLGTLGCIVTPNLFNLSSETILRYLKTLPGFSISGYNLNNIRYIDGTVFITEAERKLQDLLDSILKERRKKGLSIVKIQNV